MGPNSKSISLCKFQEENGEGLWELDKQWADNGLIYERLGILKWSSFPKLSKKNSEQIEKVLFPKEWSHCPGIICLITVSYRVCVARY